MISREGDRGRLLEDCELGDGVSSGGGGGGSTKWKVREAICIWDLGNKSSTLAWRKGISVEAYIPFPERSSCSTTRPHAINPSTVATNNDKNEAILVLVILYPSMES